MEPYAEVTVAVKVTGCPTGAVDAEEVTVVVVGAVVTTWLTAREVLVRLFASPA
jgi:hypothetical protein